MREVDNVMFVKPVYPHFNINVFNMESGRPSVSNINCSLNFSTLAMIRFFPVQAPGSITAPAPCHLWLR